MKALGRMAIGALGLVLLGAPEPADAACGDFYRVKRGDTLRSIAIRQAGTEDYQALFAANRDILEDPALIEIGQLLYVPCPNDPPVNRRAAMAEAGVTPTPRDNLGDRRAEEVATAPGTGGTVVTTETPTAAIAAEPPGDGALRVLTGSGLAPLADRDLPGQGMANLILSEALALAKVGQPVEIAFVDDWKSHLPVLMPTGAFNLGLPWPRPDCDAPDKSATAARLCDTFLFSDPIYEIQISTVVLAGSPLARARDPEDLEGTTICRPAGFPPVDLEELRANLKIVEAESPAACAAMLETGTADAVSLPEAAALRLLKDPGTAAPMVKAPYLGVSVPVHALAPKDAPGSSALIARVDAGLAQMQSSGRWLEIVSDYLRDLEKSAPSQ